MRNCRQIRQAIERCVISTFQIAESMGFKGEFRQWEQLLRLGVSMNSLITGHLVSSVEW